MIRTVATVATVALAGLLPAAALAQTAAPAAPAPFKRNWAPPPYRMKAQVMVDAIMAAHPELIGLTMHAIPPGGKEFTMFAASYHDRIGKVSGPDDALATTLGRIMVESRYKPTDNPKKSVVLVPLKDRDGNEVATAVFGFRDTIGDVRSAPYYVSAALQMCSTLSPRIASHDDLFAKAD